MSDLFGLTDEQMELLRPFFPRATANLSLMTAACWHHFCEPQWLALA